MTQDVYARRIKHRLIIGDEKPDASSLHLMKDREKLPPWLLGKGTDGVWEVTELTKANDELHGEERLLRVAAGFAKHGVKVRFVP